MRKAKVGMLVSGLMAVAVSLPAMATDQYYDSARVLSVTPQYERINHPQQSCQTEYIRESYSNSRSPVGAIIGGVAGGLLGSHIGRGNGRVAAAAVGAGVGAVVGDRYGDRRNSGYSERPVERCVTVDNWQTVNRGYLVAYRYNGRDYTTVTDQHPGDRIQVNVAVQEDRSHYAGHESYNQPVIERSNYHGKHKGHKRGHNKQYW